MSFATVRDPAAPSIWQTLFVPDLPPPATYCRPFAQSSLLVLGRYIRQACRQELARANHVRKLLLARAAASRIAPSIHTRLLLAGSMPVQLLPLRVSAPSSCGACCASQVIRSGKSLWCGLRQSCRMSRGHFRGWRQNQSPAASDKASRHPVRCCFSPLSPLLPLLPLLPSRCYRAPAPSS